MSREVLRHEEFRDKVELSRIRDWFICASQSYTTHPFFGLPPGRPVRSHIFTVTVIHCDTVNIESEGPYAPERLLVEAVSVMRDKIGVVRKAVAALETGASDGDVDMG